MADRSGMRGRMGQARLRLLALVLVLGCLSATAFATRTVTDEAGRRVEVPDHPHRIICLAPNVTDAVFALGAANDVAAVSDYSRYPVEAQAKPSVGSALQPSVETIVAFHPDLVIGLRTAGSEDAVRQLTRLGIPTFLSDPQSLQGILKTVESLGRALNRDEQASVLVRQLRQRIEAVQSRVAGQPRPKVFMPIWYDPIITIGKHAFLTELIRTAGGESITDDLPTDWPQVSMEALVVRAPETLLFVRDGKMTFDLLKDRPGWKSLPAVKARRAFYVDERIEIPGPVAITALEELSREFHP